MRYLNDMIEKGNEAMRIANKNNDEIHYRCAIYIYKNVIKMNPNSFIGFVGLGFAYEGIKDRTNAIKAFKISQTLIIKNQ